MPIVRIELWPGRTELQKAKMADEITEVITRVVGSQPESVIVTFTDIPKSNWAQGGVLASDE